MPESPSPESPWNAQRQILPGVPNAEPGALSPRVCLECPTLECLWSAQPQLQARTKTAYLNQCVFIRNKMIVFGRHTADQRRSGPRPRPSGALPLALQIRPGTASDARIPNPDGNCLEGIGFVYHLPNNEAWGGEGRCQSHLFSGSSRAYFPTVCSRHDCFGRTVALLSLLLREADCLCDKWYRRERSILYI